MGRVNVSGVREARLAATALRNVDRDLRREINAQTRTVVNPVWKGAVEAHARTGQDTRILAKGTRVATGAKPRLVAASSKRAFSGGLVPAYDWKSWEFGTKAKGVKTRYRRRSRNGGSHIVLRRTRKQVPSRNAKGRVLYPAVDEVLPRVASLWSQTAVYLTFKALKGD
ncbi:hypothetical protein [Cellulosimicrobium arenosum]|uniref:Uncharacterized protein n=1 Tax=Cellulosimicrobium arenosum TaxID=2708133 RepID=A0A927G650_9MICO|nr:hypothetical protein [Cellulosimicrobium arenosum]MBD8077696.1 hypothetical protein [Cellulosimicrobium arenosum]